MQVLPHVLLLYDNPDDRALVMRELNREFGDCQFLPITSLGELLDAINHTRWDLALTDHELRWSDGITMSAVIKARQPECPVVMFTSRGSEEIAVLAMKAGVDDYVAKPPHAPTAISGSTRLGSAVRLALERARNGGAGHETELHYQRLFDDAPVGLFRVTPEGRIVEGNQALAELLHFPNRDLLLMANLLSLFAHAGRRREFQATLQQTQVVRHFEARFCCCDDEIICAGANARLIQDRRDHGLYYEGSLEDISDLKASENVLRERLEEMRTVTEDLVALRAEESRSPQ